MALTALKLARNVYVAGAAATVAVSGVFGAAAGYALARDEDILERESPHPRADYRPKFISSMLAGFCVGVKRSLPVAALWPLHVFKAVGRARVSLIVPSEDETFEDRRRQRQLEWERNIIHHSNGDTQVSTTTDGKTTTRTYTTTTTSGGSRTTSTTSITYPNKA